MSSFIPRLYLCLDIETDADMLALVPKIEGDMASLLLRGPTKLLQQHLPSIRQIQDQGIAVLVEDPTAVLACHADGLHLCLPSEQQADAVQHARLQWGTEIILGLEGLTTRHDAMIAGEMAIDYLVVGPLHKSEKASFDQRIELADWWCQIFTIPCVVYAQTEEEIRRLCQVGVDFIALDSWLWHHPQGIQAGWERLHSLCADT